MSDQERLQNALKEHWGLVGRLLRHWGVHEDLDDAMQQTFVTLAQKIAQVEPGKERAFLASCALHIAARHRRRSAKERQRTVDLEEELPSEWDTPEKAAHHRQRLRELDQRLARMSEDNRAVFLMYEVEGWTLREIAETLGLPQGTIASRLRRARATFTEAPHDD